ncbi:MAG: hypothetical protein AAF289_14340 [Cyanobacteria bacterium P01_A01_bin.135]
MTILLCPGMHPEAATESFKRSLSSQPVVTFPAHVQPSYSPQHVVTWLQSGSLPLQQGLCIVAFSAGVVGALGAARLLWREGVPIHTLIALDGWGVPLQEAFPTHRLSCDKFTHQTSLLLGPRSGEHFYADPSANHLQLWRSPQEVAGWRVSQGPTGKRATTHRTTAAVFLNELLQRYLLPVR